jgi:hypothetical protein
MLYIVNKTKLKKTLITLLITSIVAYVTRFFFLYCFSVDILSIEEHPLVSFFSLFGFNSLRIIIRELLEEYYLSLAMSSSGNPPTGNPSSTGNSSTVNPSSTGNPSGNPTTGNPSSTGNPTGNPTGGQGYFLDPINGKYRVEDPTGVRLRPYSSSGSKQPYASNMARALEHHKNNSGTANRSQFPFYDSKDRAF